MDDYKLVYGLMDRLRNSMSQEAIVDQFTKICDSINDQSKKEDWQLAIMHWDQTNLGSLEIASTDTTC
jgi:hypothetical protein